jgi:hypothetical protein
LIPVLETVARVHSATKQSHGRAAAEALPAPKDGVMLRNLPSLTLL